MGIEVVVSGIDVRKMNQIGCAQSGVIKLGASARALGAVGAHVVELKWAAHHNP
jgi:hypothetical protein